MTRKSIRINSYISKAIVLSYDILSGFIALLLAVKGRYFFKEEAVPEGLFSSIPFIF